MSAISTAAVSRVFKQVHPDTFLAKDAKEFTQGFLERAMFTILSKAGDCTRKDKRKTTNMTDVRQSIQANPNLKKIVKKVPTTGVPSKLSVTKIAVRRAFTQAHPDTLLADDAKEYIRWAVECIAYELLEKSGKCTRKDKRKTTTVADIHHAISNNANLRSL